MPSYSLANWDGRLSQQNQQTEDNPSLLTSKPLSFGPPIRLLGPPRSRSSQEDVQSSVHTDDKMNQRVGVGGQEDRSLGVLTTETTISFIHNDTIITRDMLHESQNSDGSASEGRDSDLDLDMLQYPESVYSADAEGESEEGAIIIDNIPDVSPRISNKPYRHRTMGPGRATSSVASHIYESGGNPTYLSPPSSPFNDASSQFHESTLFSPPPQGPYANSLFSPPPSPGPAPGRRGRSIIVDVIVPGFPKGLTRRDYVQMVQTKERRSRDIEVHQSIGEAIQASLSHNAEIGVLKSLGKPARAKSNPLLVTNSTSIHHNASESSRKSPKPTSKDAAMKKHVAALKMKSVNAIAGSSSAPLPSIHIVHSQNHGNIDRKHKRVDDDDPILPKPPQKKTKSTKHGAENLPTSISGQRAPQGPEQDINYKSGTDHLRMFIHNVTPLSSVVHAHNIRFIRAQLRNLPDHFSLSSTGVIRANKHHGSSWFLWPRPKLGPHDQLQDDISLGEHWDIWEDKVQSPAKPLVVDIIPPVLQTHNPIPHSSPSPRKVDVETLPVVTPVRPRQSSSSAPESEPEGSESGSPTNKSGGASPERSPRPSMKALGKRRAVSEELETQTGQFPLSSSQSPSPSPLLHSPPVLLEAHLSDSLKNNENEMAPYFHTLDPDHRQQFDNHLIQTSLTSFPSPERPLIGPNGLFSPPLSLSQSYSFEKQHDSMGINAFSEQRSPSPLPGLPMLPEYDPGMMNSWGMSGSSASNTPDPMGGYGDGTIDPSLLGGGFFAEDDPIAPSPPPISPRPHQGFNDTPPSPAHSPPHQDPPLDPQFPVPSPSHSSYEPSEDSLILSRSPSRHPSSTSDYSHENSTSRLSQIFTRPRREARRIHPDMTAIDDLDLSLSGSSDGGTTTKKKRPKGGQSRKRIAENWPRDEAESYCHQCRNKTFIMKISCGECSKKYCARCLTTRYGERPESYDVLADFVCPFCEGSCTCDVCTRKRGGVYNRIKSVRKQNWSRAPQTISEPQSQMDKTPSKPVTVSGPVTYWAVMYDLTGQKIGTAFVGGDGKEDVVVVKRPGSVPRRRVFAGAVQPSWGLGESPIVKDLDPVVPRNPDSGGKRLREYVGNRAILYLPVVPFVQVDAADLENHNVIDGAGTIEGGRISEDPGAITSEVPVVATPDVDDTGVDKSIASPLSSLSSLNASGDEGGEGECCKWPVVVHESDFGIGVQSGPDHCLEKRPDVALAHNSLEDADVVRAITLALKACGVAVQI